MSGEVVVDSAAVEQQLAALGDSLADFSYAWPSLGAVWAEREEGVFATGGRGMWAPLASTTLLRKRSVGGGAKPLVRSGELLASLSSAQPRNEGSDWVVFGPRGRDAVVEGSWHAKGTGRMPQRSPVPRFTPSERKRFTDKLLHEIMAKAGV